MDGPSKAIEGIAQRAAIAGGNMRLPNRRPGQSLSKITKGDLIVSKYIRLALVVLMLFSLLILVPSGSNAEIITLGLDEPRGLAPQEDGYTSEWEYEDPSISVRIEKGRMFETNYLVAYVKIANASQIRTAFATTFDGADTIPGENIARRVNAVLAINGDYYSAPERLDKSYICRQGRVYRIQDTVFDWDFMWYLDVLIIDENGDFHIEQKATRDRLSHLDYTPINGFTFGPALVIDGETQTNLKDMNFGGYKPTQRMAIAQVGPLEYMCFSTESPENNDPESKGLTIEEFAQLVGSYEQVQVAYNLDGGNSNQMIFHGKKINSTWTNREIADIIYFCSAYLPD